MDTASQTAAGHAKKTVMVIDDSTTIRSQVAGTLAAAGYDVSEAHDGSQALDALDASHKPSLILCDVHMPRMGGLEFLETFKGSHPAPPVPVIMLTTEGPPDLIVRAKRAGARGWIVKPFQANLLISAVRRVLGDE
jgi:two-component system chemotaxis response regulator CheY